MKNKNTPERRCVGCMTSKDKKELVRIACYQGELTLDTIGKAKGRGAYICKDNMECVEKAYKRKALERSLSVSITESQKEELYTELKKYLGET